MRSSTWKSAATLLAAVIAAVALSGVSSPGKAMADGPGCSDPHTAPGCVTLKSAMDGRKLVAEASSYTTVPVATSMNGWTTDGWTFAFTNTANRQNGLFQLRSSFFDYCLTETPGGGQLIALPCVGSLQETWYLVTGDGGNYSVRSAADDKCVDVLNSKKADDAPVGSQTCSSATGGANQQWTVLDSQVAAGLALNHRNAPPMGCSSYSYCLKLSSAMNARLVDVTGWIDSTHQQVVTNTTPSNGYWGVSFENSSNQQGGLFQLRSVTGSGWCLTESSTTTLLATAKCANTPGITADQQQNWYLFAADNGSFSIRSAYDGKCADILNASNADGAGVGAWTCTSATGSVNEQWKLSDAKAGSTLASAFTKAQAQSCAHYIYCLSFRSAMNNRSLDSIWWGSTTEQEAVTSMNPTNGFWGVTFFSPASQIDGVFELHPIAAKPNWCLTEPASRSTSQMYVAPCVNQRGFPAGDRQEWRLVAGTNNNYSLRAAYDGYCADVLNRSDYDGAWVGSWSCSSGGGTANEQWAVDDYSGSLNAPSAATNAALLGPKAGPFASGLPSQLADAGVKGLEDWAVRQNATGKITFCNWGGYVAMGVINIVRVGSKAPLYNWSTPVLNSRQCASYYIAAGQPVVAEITMHVFTNMFQGSYGWQYRPDNGGVNTRNDYWTSDYSNDDTVATYTLSSVYTNTSFHFYGTTCNATTGYTFDDVKTKIGTFVKDDGFAKGCWGDNDISAGILTVGDAIEDHVRRSPGPTRRAPALNTR